MYMLWLRLGSPQYIASCIVSSSGFAAMVYNCYTEKMCVWWWGGEEVNFIDSIKESRPLTPLHPSPSSEAMGWES